MNASNSTNGTASDSNSNGGGGGLDPGTAISIVALVISVIALLGSILQVLQQYYASATGYSNCDEKVMGKWHGSKRRIFRLYELRFEVQFEAPVIFVCKPDNKNGPVPDQPIWMIDGTPDSLKNTRTLPKDKEEAARRGNLDSKESVHTADNERATWVSLLSELQNMEKISREWEAQKFAEDARPPKDGAGAAALPTTPAKFSEHTLAVALQVKKRSWDTMPGNVKKPYATTTMCHLVEIAAMLGIYWKEFDRSRNKYRAEGNGYVLMGDYVTDLGIMFSFQISGKSTFKEYRVIPVDEVKELCFGYASTIFLQQTDDKRLEMQNEELSGLEKLKLATPQDIAETLTLAGCNTNTVNYFRTGKAKVSHLFPVAFELLGMLGKTQQIRNSAFRMLPNPTCYLWDRRTFSMPKLIKAYRLCLKNEDITMQSPHTLKLTSWAKSICGELEKLKNPETDFSIQLIDELHKTLDSCDAYIREVHQLSGDKHGDRVVFVLREHFQVVLKLINSEMEETLANGGARMARGSVSAAVGPLSTSPPVSPTADNDQIEGDDGPFRQLSFDALNAASPEEKQMQFIDIYFSVVRPRVVEQALALLRRKTTYKTLLAGRGHGHGHGRPINLSTGSVLSVSPSRSPSPSPLSTRLPTPSPQPEPNGPSAAFAMGMSTGTALADAAAAVRRRGASTPQVQIHDIDGKHTTEQHDLETSDSEISEEQIFSDLWYTLVLRMLCWLLLHDFHKKDVQVPRSELVGSRLPVYIV